MSHSVDVRIPYEYKKLVFDVVNYLGEESPSTKTNQYGLLRALVSIPGLDSDVLSPYALLDGFFLTHIFVQFEIIDRLEFIYSPTALFEFLNKFAVKNSLGRPLEYRVVFQWKSLDFHGRSFTKADFKRRMFAYVNNGGLDDIKERFQRYCQAIIELNSNVDTAKIVDSLDSVSLKNLNGKW